MNNQIYERIGTLPLEEVFPHIEKHFEAEGKYKINIKDFQVKVTSLRLRTFLRDGVQCRCCNTLATFFAVERDNHSKGGYHLNLYGHDSHGDEVLFTHDHILARALGGADDLTNSRTVCGPCNWEKGKIEGELKKAKSKEEIAELEEKLKKYLT